MNSITNFNNVFKNKTKRELLLEALTINLLIEIVALEDIEQNKISLISLLVKAKLANSNSEAIRLIKQNSISLNEKRCTDTKKVISENDLIINGKGFLLRKGKRDFIFVLAKCSTCEAENKFECSRCGEIVGLCCFNESIRVCCGCLSHSIFTNIEKDN